ncbi:MAG: hypothetical protein AAF409_18890 [Pseudomonadota bacterium]
MNDEPTLEKKDLSVGVRHALGTPGEALAAKTGVAGEADALEKDDDGFETLGDSSFVKLFGRKVRDVEVKDKALGRRMTKMLAELNNPGTVVASISAFETDGDPTALEAPILLVLPDNAGDAKVRGKDTKKTFCWELDLESPTVVVAVEQMKVGEVVGEADGPEADTIDAGGFTLRGSDGRIYFVDGDLDGYEVFDESQRGALQVATGVDRDDLRVREVLGDHFAGTIETRARMQGRARMQSRARMLARARMMTRARMMSASANMRKELDDHSGH